ncbi:MAG: hypothetical protein R6T91_06805 [Bacteroidales bacterium]
MKFTQVFIIAAAAMVMISCNNQEDKKEAKEEKVLKTNEILEQGNDFVGKEVVVEGTIAHVCAHGGQRMFIMDDDPDKRLRVTPGEDVSAFKQEDEGSTVVIRGILNEKRLDEDYFDNWEKQIIENSGDELHVHDGKHEEGDTHDHDDINHELAKVDSFRNILNSNDLGYVPDYWIVAKSVEIKEAE